MRVVMICTLAVGLGGYSRNVWIITIYNIGIGECRYGILILISLKKVCFIGRDDVILPIDQTYERDT